LVGGQVIDTIVLVDKVWVNTQAGRDTCAIYVERSPDTERIALGDSVWWQGREAYWTSESMGCVDRPIPRIGYSGVERPDEA